VADAISPETRSPAQAQCRPDLGDVRRIIKFS
jgi:hypothetical protein